MSRILPILFNTDMVRAILDGRKTVTRRVIKKNWGDSCCNCKCIHNEFIYDNLAETVYCARCGEPLWINSFADRGYKPPCRPGDILYVRETWHKYTKRVGQGGSCRIEEFYGYKASVANSEDAEEKWRPSIHMPKEAARIWLKVTDVRVERLQDITPEQSVKEGVDDPYFYISDDWYWEKTGRCNLPCDIAAFSVLWDSTVKKTDLGRYGWEANPWIWVIEFERYEKQEK